MNLFQYDTDRCLVCGNELDYDQEYFCSTLHYNEWIESNKEIRATETNSHVIDS